MNSSNNFNICPHCNNSNSLNARFCARCGAKLVVPQEVVVCPKCHTRNSPLANFCRNCGTPVKSSAMTKICPKCGREVPSEDNVCTCGHSFATVGYVSPDMAKTSATPVVPVDNAKPAETKKDKKEKTKKGKKVVKYEYKPYGKKGGRALAIVAALFLLVFAYAIVFPCGLRFLPVNIDGGITNVGTADTRTYLYEKCLGIVSVVKDIIGGNKDIIGAFGGITNLILLACCAIMAITMVLHLVVLIVRFFTGRRSKHGNGHFLAFAIISTIMSALCFLAQTSIWKGAPAFVNTVLDIFNPKNLGDGVVYGTIYVYLFPVYYWFFYIYSLIAKRGRKKIVGEVHA